MARFKYLGEPLRPGMVVSYGPCTMIKLKKKDGTIETLTPVSPEVEFIIDADIGHEITETGCLRCIRADNRFEELP